MAVSSVSHFQSSLRILIHLLLFLKNPSFLIPYFHSFKDLKPFETENKTKQKMYPRVKVSQQDQDDEFSLEDDSRSLPLLKVFESPSAYDCSSPVKRNENDSSPSVPKIPKTSVPSLAMPPNSVSRGAQKNNKPVVEEAKPNARAISVPRPRAVLSSPDNDDMIGNMNKLISKRPSTLGKQSLTKKSPAQAKVNPGRVQAESPVRMKIGLSSREDSNNKSSLKQRKSLEPAILKQKDGLIEGKQNSKGI